MTQENYPHRSLNLFLPEPATRFADYVDTGTADTKLGSDALYAEETSIGAAPQYVTPALTNQQMTDDAIALQNEQNPAYDAQQAAAARILNP